MRMHCGIYLFTSHTLNVLHWLYIYFKQSFFRGGGRKGASSNSRTSLNTIYICIRMIMFRKRQFKSTLNCRKIITPQI